jgi:hypothetical protein
VNLGSSAISASWSAVSNGWLRAVPKVFGFQLILSAIAVADGSVRSVRLSTSTVHGRHPRTPYKC